MTVLDEVAAERARQEAHWGQQDHPNGTGRVSVVGSDQETARIARTQCAAAALRGDITWRHILEEEVCEAFAETDPQLLRAELVQVAAVAAAWVESIDRATPSTNASPAPAPVRVIVGGNLQQARNFLQERGWAARDCIVLGSPDRLCGIRGPVEVYRVGTYLADRPTSYLQAVEQNLAVIEATFRTGPDEEEA